MKLYFNYIMLLVLLPMQVGAWDLSIDGTIAAYHTTPDTKAGHPYNDFNPGLGAQVTNDYGNWRYGAIAMDYDNSINRNSFVAAGLGEYCIGSDFHACGGALAGLVTGYTTAPVLPIAAPVIEGGYKNLSVDLTTFPTSDFHAEVFTGWLRYKIWSF